MYSLKFELVLITASTQVVQVIKVNIKSPDIVPTRNDNKSKN